MAGWIFVVRKELCLLNIVRKDVDIIEIYEISVFEMVLKLHIFNISTLCLTQLYKRTYAHISALQ
jgi:hypothetical protein